MKIKQPPRLSFSLLLAFVTWLLMPVSAIAAEDPGSKEASQAGEISQVRERLGKLFPGAKLDKIQESPVAGLYEVVVGPKVVYISADGRYLVQAEIIDLETQKNLTEPRQNLAQREAIDAVGEENMLIFGGDDLKHTMTVFTDIDCGYCRKLHGEMDAYNNAGIRVRYLFFPRAGRGSDSYKKAVSSWCSEDRKEAFTQAKAGADIPETSCENPVDEHMALGQLLNVRGTPALILEDGQLLPGYIPAARLGAFLNAE